MHRSGVLTEWTRTADVSAEVSDALHNADHARLLATCALSPSVATLEVCVRAPTREGALQVLKRELKGPCDHARYPCLVAGVTADVHNDGGWGIVVRAKIVLRTLSGAAESIETQIGAITLQEQPLQSIESLVNGPTNVRIATPMLHEAMLRLFEVHIAPGRRASDVKHQFFPATSALSSLTIAYGPLWRDELRVFCAFAASSTRKEIGKIMTKLKDRDKPEAQWTVRLEWRTEAYTPSQVENWMYPQQE
jgi:hypothetical protein